MKIKTRFKIVLKKEHWWSKREIVVVVADGYHVETKDVQHGGKNDYRRFTLFNRTPEGNDHQFLCNANDIAYVLFKPVMDED